MNNTLQKSGLGGNQCFSLPTRPGPPSTPLQAGAQPGSGIYPE